MNGLMHPGMKDIERPPLAYCPISLFLDGEFHSNVIRSICSGGNEYSGYGSCHSNCRLRFAQCQLRSISLSLTPPTRTIAVLPTSKTVAGHVCWCWWYNSRVAAHMTSHSGLSLATSPLLYQKCPDPTHLTGKETPEKHKSRRRKILLRLSILRGALWTAHGP